MCIRDRTKNVLVNDIIADSSDAPSEIGKASQADAEKALRRICLLYTSDAADERSSVDLGGRRIIKKKNKKKKEKKKNNIHQDRET